MRKLNTLTVETPRSQLLLTFFLYREFVPIELEINFLLIMRSASDECTTIAETIGEYYDAIDETGAPKKQRLDRKLKEARMHAAE